LVCSSWVFTACSWARRDAAGIGIDGQIGAGDDIISAGSIDLPAPGKAQGRDEGQFLAQLHRTAGLDHLAVDGQFRHDVDQIAGNRGRQLADIGDLAFRQQGFQRLLVGFGGRPERQRDLPVVDLGEREADRIDQIAQNVLAEGPGDFLLQLARQLVVAAAGHDELVGQAGRQHWVFLDDGLTAADDVAHRGIGQMVLDVGFQLLLRLGLGILQDAGVKARGPAFAVVDGAASDEALRQLLGIDATDGDRIQAFLVLILLVAGVHLDPAVGIAISGAARGQKIDRRFHPNVFQAYLADLAAADDGCDRDAAGGGKAGGGDVGKAAGPVLEFVGRHLERGIKGKNVGLQDLTPVRL
jgi:hypothetical protein